jgi:hypothetical protein
MKKSKSRPPEDIGAPLAKLEDAYQKEHEAYQNFVESIQGQEPRAKAEEWMHFTAKNIYTYGDQESLVYLRSRGHECKEQIDELVSNWKRAAKERIERCAKGTSVEILETGETKRIGGMPLAKASDIRNVSPYILQNFWSGRDDQELSIDATMLRTVEWCDIGGFDEWWERLARSTTQDIIQGGIDSIPGSFWLFSMCRSNYALKLLGRTLERALEAIEQPLDNEVNPWRVLRQWDLKGERGLVSVDHFPYACTIVFANCRLRPTQCDANLVQQAAQAILNAQDEAGAWRCWADSILPSVETTAMCVHALALVRPRGWERAVAKAAEWLWTKQERSGCWIFRASPDPAYLSVLVLDALDLVAGKADVTFAKRPIFRNASKQVSDRRFKVGLSFPGELRGLVGPVAENLGRELGRERVFYDHFYEAELARPNLDVYLQSLYHDESEMIVIFLCSDYAKKEWCGMEWRAVRDLIKTRRDADVMLLRADSSPVPGIFSIDGYIDITDRSPEQITRLILSRLSMGEKEAPTTD